jgi:hypothetical protein
MQSPVLAVAIGAGCYRQPVVALEAVPGRRDIHRLFRATGRSGSRLTGRHRGRLAGDSTSGTHVGPHPRARLRVCAGLNGHRCVEDVDRALHQRGHGRPERSDRRHGLALGRHIRRGRLDRRSGLRRSGRRGRRRGRRSLLSGGRCLLQRRVRDLDVRYGRHGSGRGFRHRHRGRSRPSRFGRRRLLRRWRGSRAGCGSGRLGGGLRLLGRGLGLSLIVLGRRSGLGLR